MKKTVSTSTNDKFSHTNAIIDRIEKILDVHLYLRLSDGELSHLTIYDTNKIRYGIVFESEDSILFLNRINQDSEKKSIMKEKFDIGKIKSIEISGNRKIKVTFKDESINFYAGDEEPERSFFEPKVIPVFDGTEASLLEIMNYLFTEEQLKECIYYDEMEEKLFFDQKLIGSSGLGVYQKESELTSLMVYIENNYPKKDGKRIKIVRARLHDVVVKIGTENPRNLVLEKIRKIIPNGVSCSDFLYDIGCNTGLTAEENEIYLKAVSSALFLAIIERLLSNGSNDSFIKFVPIIIGETNKGKSTICRRLGLGRYYRQTTVPIDDEKRYNESVAGGLIVEMAEGVQMKRKNESTLKAFFDKTTYQYRKSYGREETTVIKRYLEIITTNDNQILTDVTGNVRYYPIRYDLLEEPMFSIKDMTDEMILQYYADALDLYYHGKKWSDYVQTEEIQRLAEKLRDNSTKEIDGMFELQQVANELAPNVGDFVSNDDLREGLYHYDEKWRFNEKQVTYAFNEFKKACDKFGFKIEHTPHKNRNGKSVRGLIRFKPL